MIEIKKYRCKRPLLININPKKYSNARNNIKNKDTNNFNIMCFLKMNLTIFLTEKYNTYPNSKE